MSVMIAVTTWSRPLSHHHHRHLLACAPPPPSLSSCPSCTLTMADKDQENGHGLFQVVSTLFSPGFLLTTHHHHLPHPVPQQT
ncbi:uncharacterized protein LACBIDRAFT_316931 [Laccaria bicolor S238N-H82]|uniref:Predicted protein n=1 Tax=Laccaria bicolor (strain S238N-H82 / ATCC MYA-4686) TaxID=486041 RepID=B0D5A7_LACBS|nr:uncharacterized protein LACBIDRAFT_316931 [Laccaria bicolor S238N-H82]EDR10488.1 predicted protein [Laccaria bicolor S238N-H82]|eukprot:XP_001878938.1 predicted protein [Laccaria bicolor S238N-H82]